ncbi:MAG: VanW family protein [Clostridia bacterium]|nr:VanW family protein [Clostridia bacterium]
MKYVLLCILLLLCTGCKSTTKIADATAPTAAATHSPAPTAYSLTRVEVQLTAGKDTLTYTLWDLGLRQKDGKRTLDAAVFSALCEKLNTAYGQSSTDAALTTTPDSAEAFSIQAEQDGYQVDTQALRQAILAYEPGQVIELTMEPVKASITAADLQQRYGLISQFTTSFSGSTLSKKNRVKNMALAVERINGQVIKPGEEFSMNKTILDRTKQNGYYKAAAIRDGTYVQEYGGGVCQVSSTLCNAALMADLQITERHHHSWPMHYVPIGRDATIATGYKDFTFVNSTAGDLLIRARMDEKKKTLTVELYGELPTDFAYIEVVSEKTGSLPGKGSKTMLDESLPAGSKVEEKKARQGKTSVTYKDYYDSNGQKIKREVAWKDTYPSIEGLVYVSADLYH